MMDQRRKKQREGILDAARGNTTVMSLINIYSEMRAELLDLKYEVQDLKEELAICKGVKKQSPPMSETMK